MLGGIAGHTVMMADLKSSPGDEKELYALGVCFIAGCFSQLFFLMSRVGRDKSHLWPRWIGEIALGGISAYVFCVGYLRYGPSVALTTLIMIALLGGFAGQRALVWAISWALKKFGVAEEKEAKDDDGA